MSNPDSGVVEKRITLQDYAAAFVAVTLTIGILGLASFEREIPSELTNLLGSACTWLFMRSTQTNHTHTMGPGR